LDSPNGNEEKIKPYPINPIQLDWQDKTIQTNTLNWKDKVTGC
jgi:hypothetical protein